MEKAVCKNLKQVLFPLRKKDTLRHNMEQLKSKSTCNTRFYIPLDLCEQTNFGFSKQRSNTL